MFTRSSFSLGNGRCCNIQTQTTQDGELGLPDSLHKILISHKRSTGLGICPTRLKLFSFSLSVFCLSGLPCTLIPSKVEMAIGSAEWLKAGELFSQVPAKWGEQLGRNSNPLEEPKGSSPSLLWLPLHTGTRTCTRTETHTHTHSALILWFLKCLTLLSSPCPPYSPPQGFRSVPGRPKQWNLNNPQHLILGAIFRAALDLKMYLLLHRDGTIFWKWVFGAWFRTKQRESFGAPKRNYSPIVLYFNQSQNICRFVTIGLRMSCNCYSSQEWRCSIQTSPLIQERSVSCFMLAHGRHTV